MFGLKTKSAVVLFLCLFVTVVLGCEEEKKEVCCSCTCFNPNNVSGEVQFEESIVRGVNLNCEKECRVECEDMMGWSLHRHAEGKCPPEQQIIYKQQTAYDLSRFSALFCCAVTYGGRP